MPRIPRFTQCLVLSSALAAIPCGMGAAQEPPDDDFDAEMATVQEPPNGDFEDGVLDPWFGSGDIGVFEENVLKGAFSGFLTTGNLSGIPAVGDVCSTLESGEVFPSTDRARVKVAFKVRYKTNEGTGPFAFFEDPFHAQLRTAKGTVDLLTIKTDGIFWTKGDPTNTEVKKLRHPPQIPPFKPGDLYASETPTLSVRSELKLKGCEPVVIKFQICDWSDQVVDSAAFLDEVKIKFKEDGDECTEDMIDSGIMQQLEESPPEPREP
jgi:hypothetical protein